MSQDMPARKQGVQHVDGTLIACSCEDSRGAESRKPAVPARLWKIGLSRYEHDSKVKPECSHHGNTREMATANNRRARSRRLHRVRPQLQPHRNRNPTSQEALQDNHVP
jgi:hypothetical protein